MMNVLTIGGYKAVLSFDTDAGKFRGKFVGLTGDVGFEGADVAALQSAGELALNTFLADCQQRDVNPAQSFTGELALKLAPQLHEALAVIATAAGISVEQWIASVLEAEATAVVGPLLP